MEMFCSRIAPKPNAFWPRRARHSPRGKGGHLIITLDGKRSVPPQRGGSKEIGKGLWQATFKRSRRCAGEGRRCNRVGHNGRDGRPRRRASSASRGRGLGHAAHFVVGQNRTLSGHAGGWRRQGRACQSARRRIAANGSADRFETQLPPRCGSVRIFRSRQVNDDFASTPGAPPLGRVP